MPCARIHVSLLPKKNNRIYVSQVFPYSNSCLSISTKLDEWQAAEMRQETRHIFEYMSLYPNKN